MSLSIPAGFSPLFSPLASTFTLFTINPYLALHVSSLSYSPFSSRHPSLHLSNSLFNLNNFKKSLPAPLPLSLPRPQPRRYQISVARRFVSSLRSSPHLSDCTYSAVLYLRHGFFFVSFLLVARLLRSPEFPTSRPFIPLF